MISVDFPNLDQLVCMEWHGDGPISPSTAYEVYQTPFICLERMCEPFHVGLVPQPMHNGFVNHQAETQYIS